MGYSTTEWGQRYLPEPGRARGAIVYRSCYLRAIIESSQPTQRHPPSAFPILALPCIYPYPSCSSYAFAHIVQAVPHIVIDSRGYEKRPDLTDTLLRLLHQTPHSPRSVTLGTQQQQRLWWTTASTLDILLGSSVKDVKAFPPLPTAARHGIVGLVHPVWLHFVLSIPVRSTHLSVLRRSQPLFAVLPNLQQIRTRQVSCGCDSRTAAALSGPMSDLVPEIQN